MNNRRLALSSVLAISMFAGGFLIAQRPEDNVGRRHVNLMEAQRLVSQAFDKIQEAQRANEWDMNGHAQKAKDLLDQANREIKLAAETANRDRH